jgi:hypothetical protein
MKYKIYKLIHNGVVVYVGRTKQSLKRRKQFGYKSNAAVQAIYKQCDIELIEETNDVSREDYWVQHYKDTVFNMKRGERGLSYKEWHKEYYQDNKEKRQEQVNEYYQANKEKINQYRRECYQKNKLK